MKKLKLLRKEIQKIVSKVMSVPPVFIKFLKIVPIVRKLDTTYSRKSAKLLK
jgi:hypothetical protein